MKKCILMAWFILVSFNLSAYAQTVLGPGGTGGGDMDAVEFLQEAKDVGDWMKSKPDIFEASTISDYLSIIATFSKQMDGVIQPPIRFVPNTLSDAFGVSKMALFVKDPVGIVVHRGSWAKLSVVQQYQLAALEMFGLIGIESRYSVDDLIRTNFSEINLINGNGVGYKGGDAFSETNGPSNLQSKFTWSERSITVVAVCVTEKKTLVATASVPARAYHIKTPSGEKYLKIVALASDEEVLSEDNHKCTARINNWTLPEGGSRVGLTAEDIYSTDGFITGYTKGRSLGANGIELGPVK